jgi:hypothetical protein
VNQNLHLAAALLVLGVHASAQSFNVDMGTLNAAPSSAFGAAANQPGTWNPVDCDLPGATALVDLAGTPTGATIVRAGGVGGNFSTNHPGTLADDELLLDDADDFFGATTWTISGLAAGTYEVTTYGWAPDSDGYRTGVSVNGGPTTVVGGAWSGSYVLGVHHALDTVVIAPGETIAITVSVVLDFGTFNGVQLRALAPPIVLSCPGDGSATACPCGNPGSAGHGCANSVFAAGGRLTGGGSASVAGDTVVLTAANLTGTSAVFFQGDALVPPVAIDDGLGCIGGVIVRLGTRPVAANASAFPEAGDPSISVRGALPPAGGTRHYQCFYRNTAPLFCPPATSNRTNGVTVTWAP